MINYGLRNSGEPYCQQGVETVGEEPMRQRTGADQREFSDCCWGERGVGKNLRKKDSAEDRKENWKQKGRRRLVVNVNLL